MKVASYQTLQGKHKHLYTYCLYTHAVISTNKIHIHLKKYLILKKNIVGDFHAAEIQSTYRKTSFRSIFIILVNMAIYVTNHN